MPYEKQRVEGALWIKSGAKGEYLSGVIEIDGVKTSLVAFKNQNKKEAKHPDWKIMESKPKEAFQSSITPDESATLDEARRKEKEKQAETQLTAEEEAEIPFR